MSTRGATQAGDERARVATAIAFGTSGVAFASWVSRLPAARETLGLSARGLGLLLLCSAVGAMVALPASGPVVHRLGTARTVRLGATLLGGGLLGVGLMLVLGSTIGAGLALFAFGAGNSLWDVGMNVEGAAVEQQLGRPLMPRLHAAFSLGTVGGALLGAACAGVGLAVPVQLALTSAALAVAVAIATRRFLAVENAPEKGSSSGTARAWREPRTLAIGLLVLAFAFTEGSANDWVAVALVDDRQASGAVGALGFALFVTAMTLARVTGGAALARYGRVVVLRASAGLGLAGALVFVLAPSLPVAMAGLLLWGAGAALGFPVGMSAAADDPARAAARVSVVSSVGYAAFLAGPPLIGFVGDSVGVLRALLVVAVALAIGLAVSGAAAPPAGGTRSTEQGPAAPPAHEVGHPTRHAGHGPSVAPELEPSHQHVGDAPADAERPGPRAGTGPSSGSL